jgi:cell division protein FtsB
MDAGKFITSFLADFLVTVIAYGLGPILLLEFHKGPISPKKLKWFHIIYTIIVSFTFNIIMSLLGLRQVGSFTPAIIWGTVFYRINKKNFDQRAKAIPSETYIQQEAQMKQFVVDDATGEVISETPVEEPKPVVLTYAPDFKLSGPPKPIVDDSVPSEPPSQPKPSKRNNVLFVVLAAICIASLAGNAVQAYLKVNTQTQLAKIEEDLADKDTLIQNLKESRSTLQKQLADAQDDINVRDNMIDEIAPEAFAMKTYIGFIYDGSKYCHSYNCSQFPFEDCASDGFYAHNVEYCEWLGYPKHSGCWD